MSIFNVVWISDPLQFDGQTFSYVEEVVLLMIPRPREDGYQDLNEKNQSEKSQTNREISITSPSREQVDRVNDKISETLENYPRRATEMISYESLELLPIETPFQPEKSLSSNGISPYILESDIIPCFNTIPLRTDSFPVGIVNLGSSCYANSVIQMLFRVSNVRKLVSNLQFYHQKALLRSKKLVSIAQDLTRKGRSNDAMRFIRRFEDLIKGIQLAEGLNHMFHQLQKNEPSISATFTQSSKSMQALPGIFSRNEQEDADEYLVTILSALKDILPSSQKDHFSIKILHERKRQSLYSSDSVETSRIDVLNRISLPLIEGIRSISELIEALLETETTEIQIGSEGLPGLLTESKRIIYLPEFLPIQLQRLVYGSKGLRKISQPLNVPEILDFSPFLKSASSMFYKLEMFLDHCGGPHCGHYVAYSRDRATGNKWFEFNDEKVSQVPEEYIEFKMSTAYIYIYRKVQ